MNTNNRIAEIKKRLKQGRYYVPYAPDDIEYLLSELSKTRLERNQLEANKNYYKEQLAKAKADGRLVKRGKWIYEHEWKCSSCGWAQSHDFNTVPNDILKYCPNCGAKMSNNSV